MSIDTGQSLSFNQNFPAPNVEQSSQQFRDNFSIIKTAIENLQIAQNAANSVISLTTSIGTTGQVSIALNYANNTLILPTGSPTSGPTTGAIRYDTVTSNLQFYSNAVWNSVVYLSNGSLSLSNLTIGTDLTLNYTPNAATDAVNVSYVTNAITVVNNSVAYQISAVNANAAAIQADLNSEKTTRANAITNLQSQISNSTTSVSNTSSLLSSLSSQVTSLSNSVANEANSRIAAISSQANSISNLNTQVNNAIALASQVSTDLSAEVTNRQNGDSYLYSVINAVSSAVTTNSNSVTAEASARANAISNVAASVTALTTSLANAVAQEQSDLSNTITLLSGYLSLAGGTVNGNLNLSNASANISNSNATTIQLFSNGNIWAAGNINAVGTITGSSDVSLKYNIRTIPSALDTVCKLRGTLYNRHDLSGNPEQMGVIAQEVQPHLPQVVFKQDNGLLSVSYGSFIGLLIEAIKELRDEVNRLK